MEAAEVLASAVRLAAEGSADSDDYWDLIGQLHRIPEPLAIDAAQELLDRYPDRENVRAASAKWRGGSWFTHEPTVERPLNDC